MAVANDNINNKRPQQYVKPGIILLVAWLNLKEAVPIIAKQLEHENNESIWKIYKFALTD